MARRTSSLRSSTTCDLPSPRLALHDAECQSTHLLRPHALVPMRVGLCKAYTPCTAQSALVPRRVGAAGCRVGSPAGHVVELVTALPAVPGETGAAQDRSARADPALDEREGRTELVRAPHPGGEQRAVQTPPPVRLVHAAAPQPGDLAGHRAAGRARGYAAGAGDE